MLTVLTWILCRCLFASFQQFGSVQSLSRVQLFATPWTTARQASLSITNSRKVPESTQTHVHWVGDAIQPSHPVLSSSPPALNLSQHQGLFKWVSSLHQMAKVLEFQLQHLSYQYFQQEWLFLIKNPKSGNIRTKLCVFFFPWWDLDLSIFLFLVSSLTFWS